MNAGCTDKCYAMPDCTVCHRRKKPCGRSAPDAMAGSLCDDNCVGYYNGPWPGHLWPDERTGRREPPKGVTR